MRWFVINTMKALQCHIELSSWLYRTRTNRRLGRETMQLYRIMLSDDATAAGAPVEFGLGRRLDGELDDCPLVDEHALGISEVVCEAAPEVSGAEDADARLWGWRGGGGGRHGEGADAPGRCHSRDGAERHGPWIWMHSRHVCSHHWRAVARRRRGWRKNDWARCRTPANATRCSASRTSPRGSVSTVLGHYGA